ncbi:RNA polymerase sigma factor [Filimonas effusa]|uniref:Sigma-70 family RNA polymerase sigma factor n=1 Tax=Filimonas effusa TaxID=2508721 RepID=A0A4Q1D339_9BACT|nr:sigma-70 family RNA polymerase sigma factor [Filimonas effusa]RXK82789.1 sigma-70 family RNA polymerase sigma factor [Filimonas effusa]
MELLATIVIGCIGNEPRYQRALYERYYGYALKIVFRYIYRYDRAVDVSNDGFVKLFGNFSRFHCQEPEHLEKILMGWIRKIMVNTAIDALRKQEMMPEIGGIPEHIWEEADPGQSAEQRLFHKELIVQIKELPPSYRVVFNMYVIDGFSHQEIASQLGITTGTSKSNLAKARAHLQKKMNNDLQESDICSN